MRRRELLASLAAAVWPLTTSAQQARTPVHDWQNRVADPRTCFWLVFMSLGPECELAVRGRVGRGVDEGVESTPCTVPFQFLMRAAKLATSREANVAPAR